MSKKMLEICAVCGWKAGIVKGKQRYRCKNCNENQAETDDRVKYSGAERKYALVMYLYGCGFRIIARIMSKIFGKHYRHQTIMNWIKRAGLKEMSEKKQEKAEVLELKEVLKLNKSID